MALDSLQQSPTYPTLMATQLHIHVSRMHTHSLWLEFTKPQPTKFCSIPHVLPLPYFSSQEPLPPTSLKIPNMLVLKGTIFAFSLQDYKFLIFIYSDTADLLSKNEVDYGIFRHQDCI